MQLLLMHLAKVSSIALSAGDQLLSVIFARNSSEVAYVKEYSATCFVLYRTFKSSSAWPGLHVLKLYSSFM